MITNHEKFDLTNIPQPLIDVTEHLQPKSTYASQRNEQDVSAKHYKTLMNFHKQEEKFC